MILLAMFGQIKVILLRGFVYVARRIGYAEVGSCFATRGARFGKFVDRWFAEN